MNRFTTTIQATIFVSMAILLMVSCGCQPEASKEEPVAQSGEPANPAGTESDSPKKSGDSDGSVEPEASVETSSLKKTNAEGALANVAEPDFVGDGELISGDLDSVDWKSLVGKEVTISGELVIVDTFDLARRGRVTLARKRLFVPTNHIDPNDADPNGTSIEGGSNVAKVTAAQKRNDQGSIMLDDGVSKQNVFPPPLFPNLGKTHPTVRVGSTLNGVTGKLTKERDKLYLIPSQPLQWTPSERPARPDVGNAKVTVASFNVLNFFTTIDNGSNRARGADSKSELKRQEAKLVSAIIEMEADIVGVMELENNLEAEVQLVAALNKKLGKEVYKGCGLPDGFEDAPGGDNAIRVGFIYRSDRVDPVGPVSMIRNEAFDVARTPVVQKFQSKTSDRPFTVVVNHFKSKGSSNRAYAANKNKGDGQGAFNAKRRSQSLAICDYVEELKQVEASPRVLVIGDLNAYGEEDPIDAFRANGLVDLHSQTDNELEDYSYIFRGQSGSLDHAMATKALADDVTGIATWHINADEPRFLDYNEEYNPASLYEADPFRSSDHDPVLIGIGK